MEISKSPKKKLQRSKQAKIGLLPLSSGLLTRRPTQAACGLNHVISQAFDTSSIRESVENGRPPGGQGRVAEGQALLSGIGPGEKHTGDGSGIRTAG